MRHEKVETDVLCVGGGIAGLMAAIRASELGAKVTIAEKANTVRSGSGGMGNDHFICYIPEVHGQDIKPIIDEIRRVQIVPSRQVDFIRTWLEKSFDIVKLWDSWGIPMKYQGNYEFAGHAFPGRPFIALKYSGGKQKPILTGEARKRGVQILDRVMVFDLLTNDGVIGAVGINTREDRIIEFHAKAVILGTGLCTRLYPSPTPAWTFNMAYSPTNTGDGRAMAYRAGAELANLEMTIRWAGPKYFSRCGKGTWVGVFRDPHGKPVGPFVTKPDKKYGDIAGDIYTTLFEDYAKSGKGPVYMDCGGISDDDFDYMMHWMKNEGNTTLLNYLKEENVDPRKNPIEFTGYEMLVAGGVQYNKKGETSLKGLYAAGDESSGTISCAAIFGWIAGENAAKHVKKTDTLSLESMQTNVEEKVNLFHKIRNRAIGADWQEVNTALQQIMYDYAGSIRSETMLEAGQQYIRRLRDKAYATIKAQNQHELMHCLETLDLLEVGELIFVTARERKETRGRHVRPDYPFTNPLLSGKLLTVKKVNGKPVTEWR